MTQPAKHKATYQDLLALPSTLVGEILGGNLHTHPRPAPKHTRAYSALGYTLGGPFDGGIGGPGGWWILDEPELHLGDDIIVPDIAGWRRKRMPQLPTTAWFQLAPDWVCEILSPRTAQTDRIVKMPIYARESISHLWFVDPDLQTLEVYQLTDNRWTLLSALKDDDPVSQPPFEAIEFNLDVLWG